MITFKSLGITDFMSIDKIVWDFNEATNLCLGKNMDSAAASDNGSGKSAIADAFRWCLFGETTRQAIDKSLPVDAVIREGEQYASVSVTFIKDNTEVIVTRIRKKSSGSLTVWVDGVTSYTGKGAQTTLNEFLGIDAIQFSNLVHLDSSYPQLFTRGTDRERKDILAELVDVSYLNTVYELVRGRVQSLDKAKLTLEGEVASYSRVIDVQQDRVKDIKNKGKLAKQNTKATRQLLDKATAELTEREYQSGLAVTKWEEASEKHEEAITETENSIACAARDTHKQELLIAVLQKDVSIFTNAKKEELQEPVVNKAVADKKIEESNNATQSGRCPTCGQLICTDNEEQYLESVKEELEAAEVEIATIKEELEEGLLKYAELVKEEEEALDSLEDVEQEAVSKRDDFAKSKAAVATLKTEMEHEDKKHFEQEKLVNKLKNDLKHHTSQLAGLKKELVSTQENLDSYKTRKTTAEQDIKELVVSIEDLNFWKTGFGSKGVPSLYIEMILPKISAGIQKYADILTDGDIQVSLKAYKETKSGSPREAIQIIATNSYGASVYGSNSRGERCRIDLAVTLGLMDYFKLNKVFECNTLICDEVFDGLDSRGVELAVKALEKAAIPSVLVMSHNESFKSYFNNVIVVKKENGVSTLEA